MIANQITNLLWRILPGHTLYYLMIGVAVIGLLVAGYAWWRKKGSAKSN